MQPLKKIIGSFKWRSMLSYLLIFMVAGFLGNVWMTRSQTEGEAPEIIAQSLTGAQFQEDFTQLKSPALVYFFADWCPICKVQHPVISAIYKDYAVIGVAMQSGSLANVRQYVADREMPFPVVNDETGYVSARYGVNGVPATFIIDTQGRIQYSTRGYATEAGLRSRLWLTKSPG